jgi:hypothetical protein
MVIDLPPGVRPGGPERKVRLGPGLRAHDPTPVMTRCLPNDLRRVPHLSLGQFPLACDHNIQ